MPDFRSHVREEFSGKKGLKLSFLPVSFLPDSTAQESCGKLVVKLTASGVALTKNLRLMMEASDNCVIHP
jgi:hypothetical protein